MMIIILENVTVNKGNTNKLDLPVKFFFMVFIMVLQNYYSNDLLMLK